MKVEFVQNWLQIACACPRLFYETYICSNLDSLDALVVTLLSSVEMRLILPSLRGLPTDQAKEIVRSAKLVAKLRMKAISFSNMASVL